jgi:hypothetical protein
MRRINQSSPCAGCPLSRRDFFTRSSAAVAGASLGWLGSSAPLQAAEPKPKTRIRTIYSLHGEQQEGPDWPNKGYDFRPAMERINAELGRRCKGFEFVPCLAKGASDAEAIVKADQATGNIDGYLVYQMNCWNQVVQTIAASGKPVLYADFQFGGSGGFLVYNAAFLRNQAPNVGFVASSDLKDVAAAVESFRVVKEGGSIADFKRSTQQVRCNRTPSRGKAANRHDDLRCLPAKECVRRMKESKLLAIRDQNSGPSVEVMGIAVQPVAFAELNEAWKSANPDEARAVADGWAKEARRVEGVSRETLEASAAMYLAEKALLKKHGATGITINCLGGFYGGHIHAYPCLGFHQLVNEGLVGGCECDVRSATTMMTGTILTQGRPGYISDPVIDTSKRQIIYAHCVASNRVFGPSGKANSFDILTHSEDRQGASVRSHLPVGHMTTSLEFEPSRKEILFHRALAVANDPDDRACRTKLCAEPAGDIEKLFGMWDQWGWHRVTFYGDLREPIYALAEELGWKVVEEA